MKTQRFLVFLTVIALMLAAAACDTSAPADATPTPTSSPSSEMSAEQIADQAVAASAEVDTCQFDMDMTMDMSFTEAGETYEIPFTVTSEGAVDKPNAKLFTASAMAMEIPGEGTMELSIQTYIVDRWMYLGMEMPGVPLVWVKSPMETQDWEGMDVVSGQMDLLLDVEVDLVGTEAVDGTECYVLEIVPDMDSLWALVEMAGGDEGLPSDLDPEELITDVSVTQWVAQDTFFTRKTAIDLTMALTPEALGVSSEEAGDFDGTAELALVTTMHHINQPVTIELPPEAEQAAEM
ncbi:MAG: DUF6612 family protein [Chloroflexota bacterium]|nr:DUF6612 family protein [Chloroflexota bacterium]